MAKIMLHRYTHTDSDQYYERRVRDIKTFVGSGLLMGHFMKRGNVHYCIKPAYSAKELWYEVQAGFPLIKVYEEGLESEPQKEVA